MLIHDFLRNSAKRFPDKPAVIHQKSEYTFSQLDAWSDTFALSLLAKGVERGDRVAIFLDNGIEYLVTYFGILKSGGVVVALNSQLVARELCLPLDDCTPNVIVTDNKHYKTAAEAVKLSEQQIEILLIEKEAFNYHHKPLAISYQLSDSDLAMIIYTSGTTGKPKGVMLSHGNLSANADSIIEYLKLTSDDKIMIVLPFYYSYGNSLLTTHIKVGGTLVLDNRFVYPNVILDTMAKQEVTGFAGVPSHFAILIKKSAIRKYDLSKLRYVTQAGGGMPPAMIKEFLDIIPDINFCVMYGQTEASARLSYLEPDRLLNKMGSVGKAIPGVELDVLNDQGKKVSVGEQGEIVARGENIMQGYWNDPEQTAGVLRTEGLFTGDLARIDEDGFIYIISRKKDMIKSGANRISPFEIEDILCQMSGIMECAAVGIPDDILGEVIKLCVVVQDENITEREVAVFCKQNLAFYKFPKKIEILPELPKTASGKIKREELKKANG
ncbi:MAG: acyl--CoA ligase [PVC group bacterium]|nr:acyl--CoA ligase [PVC group bacterium]